jgi:serine/threonine-protein kinase
MEYIPGTDLKTLLRQRGRFSIEEAIHLIVQACAGIGYAHRAGLVHCDVKPQNMLVTPDQRLKVTDFGIARALASIKPDEQSEVVWGSPQYFSPEQATGAPPSPASDVYSLGVILYEMLTGQLPFKSDNPSELARLHREIPPTPPRRLNPAIPPALEQIVLKVLSKEPAARYRTADQLGRVLLNFSESTLKAGVPAAAQGVSVQPAPAPSPQPISQQEKRVVSSPAGEADPGAEIDWITVGLGLLAVLSVGGLVPFWLFIWFSLNPPVR